ncbi:MAG: PrsW family intramembrane metalloprotease [bacterium]|nr:PrsW family intramembrane metalloprotease [bacterium]
MADQITSTTILFALLGGILPPLLWLWFWLKEDRYPEPRSVLALTFFFGMLAVLAAIFFEKAFLMAEQKLGIEKTAGGLISLLLAWALIEETVKYLAARFAALRRKSFDEPVDALIYLITAALGFAALENVLFLLKAFDLGMMSGLATTNLRFFGATLLHVATSGIVGASIAFSFFHKENMRRNIMGGLAVAAILHFIFNYSIILNNGESMLKIFIPLWIVIILILFVFKKEGQSDKK